MKLKYILNLSLAVFLMVCGILPGVYAQNPATDTLNKGKPTAQFDEIMNGTYSDTLTTHIWMFGNPDCARCEECKRLFLENGLPFIYYDLRDNNMTMLVHDLVVFDAKSNRLSYAFPVVVVNTKIYYNMMDLVKFAAELKGQLKQ